MVYGNYDPSLAQHYEECIYESTFMNGFSELKHEFQNEHRCQCIQWTLLPRITLEKTT